MLTELQGYHILICITIMVHYFIIINVNQGDMKGNNCKYLFTCLFHFRISQTNQMFGAFPYYSGSYTHLAEIHIQEL